MSKVAVLGANGFVGSRIASHLSQNNIVLPVTRSTLNLLDSQQVAEFLKTQKFDVVINAAATMTDPVKFFDTRNNLGIFMNFYNNRMYYKKFINLASGAEYDRSTNIENAKEETIFDCLPDDSYGFGQNIKSRLSAETENFYNLRIFNCFGRGEIITRIFPKLLEKTQDTFTVSNNRYFDYFYVKDLLTVVEHYVKQNNLEKDINCVYPIKHKISTVVEKFMYFQNIKRNLTIVSESTNNYTGDGSRLERLNLSLYGLDKGLIEYD